METAAIFKMVNLIALLSWGLLIIAPRWVATRRVVISGAITLLFSALYLAYFIGSNGDFNTESFSTLENVMELFTKPEAVLIGWLHYLAFDLFVGTWIVSNAQQHGISHWAIIPCLLLTFMLGPVGCLLYFIVRAIFMKGKMVNNF